MQWLPAIRYKNAGWLLPLSPDSAQLFTGLIYDTSDLQGPLADPDVAAEAISQRLLQDPALAIFSILELHSRHPETAAKSFDIEAHASWFCQVVCELFHDRDRQLLTLQLADRLPTSRPRALAAESWQVIAERTLDVPLDRWMERAGEWLALTGPSPPGSWRKQWPNFEACENEILVIESQTRAARLGYGRDSFDLYRVARNQHELQQLRQRFTSCLNAEKMASLRQLAYGLSHEINNPLASIRTRAEQLIAEERKEPRRGQLRRIVDSAMRSHEMIADMMYFAKPPRPQVEKTDPWQLACSIVEQFQKDADRRGIRLLIGSDTPQSKKPGRKKKVYCDPRQVGDALRALIRNSIEAIGSRGTVSVSVDFNGRRISWTVSDSGPGLTLEARQHAFDPYYSGRDAGRGLGLGLCRVYRVARAHGGGASIEHTEVGCRARMWVPIKSQTTASN